MRTRCSRIGTKSFDLEHEIAADGRVVAEGKSVLVSYDYERGESVPVPDELRERLTRPPAAPPRPSEARPIRSADTEDLLRCLVGDPDAVSGHDALTKCFTGRRNVARTDPRRATRPGTASHSEAPPASLGP